jgi:DNA ligase (NAD+)
MLALITAGALVPRAAGPGAGSKLGKAEELGLRIIDAAQFKILVEQGPDALPPVE